MPDADLESDIAAKIDAEMCELVASGMPPEGRYSVHVSREQMLKIAAALIRRP